MKAYFVLLISLLLLSCDQNSEIEEAWFGFINPDKAFYNDNFETCSDTILLNFTSRYSRKEVRAGYYGGNKAIKKTYHKTFVDANFTDSGYLTYRFILNCKGEVGRFVIEEADLNFEAYHFSNELKKALLDFTYHLDTWRPLCFNEENKDVYMYITYKFKDGKLIEILP